jgi:hypothetical protein
MNILDKNYPEISVKTDAEDLRVMINYLNELGEFIQENGELSRTVSIMLLKEVRDKLMMKEFQKKGTKKLFLMKFKAYHIAALYESFIFNSQINQVKPFEQNCIRRYKNQFHQKLIAL